LAQTAPLPRSANEHVPFAGLQTPAASHALGARHVTGVPATHFPALSQWSFWVQALLSALQAVLRVRLEHVPSLPATLQATQSVAEPPLHAVSQQKPSTQLFVEHSWQPATLQ
jgi:hypothetical protein